jgi:hypothetical protein
MQDRHFGPWIREQFLKKASAKIWNTLLSEYAALQSKKTIDLRSMSSQRGKAPFLIASYWVQGGRWARIFCDAFELPDAVWMRHDANRVEDEDVIPALPLPPLHDFQVSAYGRLRGLLKKRSRGKTALLSLPTGAGKTRVIVEAICDHMAQTAMEGQSLAVLWIAHSSELQLQAWECFRAVWQVPPTQTEGRMQIRRVQPLRLVRMCQDHEWLNPDSPAIIYPQTRHKLSDPDSQRKNACDKGCYQAVKSFPRANDMRLIAKPWKTRSSPKPPSSGMARLN